MTAAAAVYSVSGFLALIQLASSTKKIKQIRQLPLLYIFVCGTLFVSYMLMLFSAIGLANSEQQVLEVGLLNYLWPVLTLLLSIVLLNKTPVVIQLIIGTSLAFYGIFLIFLQGEQELYSLEFFLKNLNQNPVVYLLALLAAFFWALYSTLTRRWIGGKSTGGVLLFLPFTAVIFLVINVFVVEHGVWNIRSCIEAAVLGLAIYLGYSFWDIAMRGGNIVVVTSAAYLTPFISTIISSLYLSINPHPLVWLGCAVLIVGSWLSGHSMLEK